MTITSQEGNKRTNYHILTHRDSDNKKQYTSRGQYMSLYHESDNVISIFFSHLHFNFIYLYSYTLILFVHNLIQQLESYFIL